MSTRATYVIGGTAFYIHYDGYPAGAARYLGAMVRHPNKRGGLAEAFLRANELAEFTEGHEAHGDTEYRYTYEPGTDLLRAWEVRRYDSEKWECIFAGTLETFLNKFHPIPEGEPLEPWMTHAGRTIHREELEKWARERLEYAVTALEKGWSGNAGSAIGEVCRLGELASRVGVAEWALEMAHRYYEEHLVPMGHPENPAESSYWKEYLGGRLPEPIAKEAV